MSHPFLRAALVGTLLLLTSPALAPAANATPLTLDLRVDADRNGSLTPADDPGEDAASVANGAIFLANVDDDGGRCDDDLRRRMSARVKLADLTACHDGADTTVNGPADERDLARAAIAPADTTNATLTIDSAPAGRVHVFLRDSDTTNNAWRLVEPGRTPLDLRAGAELGIEATDIVRDPAQWDGTVRLTITAPDATPDTVALRAAPLLAIPATQKAQRLLANTPRSVAAIDEDARTFVRDQLRFGRRLLADKRAGKPTPPDLKPYLEDAATWKAHVQRNARETRAFQLGQRAFLRSLGRARLGAPVTQQPWVNDWVQDAFEPLYQSLPTVNGRAQTMRVAAMANAPVESGDLSPRNPMVQLSASLLRNLRGADSGVVQHVLPAGAPPTADGWKTTGTMEVSPPVPGAPRGRLIVGNRTAKLGPATANLVAGQGGAQPLLQLDTGWLDIGHTDEFLAFVPADTPRGWVAIVADPGGALDLLRDVPGDTPVRRGLRTVGGKSAQLSARAVLGGPVARASRRAAEKIDAQLGVLRRELGLTDADIVRVPVLYSWSPRNSYVVAWTGNSVNGVAPGGRRFLAPTPHGPVRAGKDLFATRTTTALRRVGVTAQFVETWPLPHTGSGEIHCMTNALRDLGDGAWWRAG